MTYGFSSSRSDPYRVKAEDVAVDFERGLLTITATKRYFGSAPVCGEYPLILVRLCTACGTPVAIYARGSLKAFEKQAGHGHFLMPWDDRAGWHYLPIPGAFALVAGGGHRFTESEYGLRAQCEERDLRLIPFAQPDPPPPPAPAPRPQPPKRRASPAPVAAVAPVLPPPATVAAPVPDPSTPSLVDAPSDPGPATSPERPQRTQLTFAW